MGFSRGYPNFSTAVSRRLVLRSSRGISSQTVDGRYDGIEGGHHGRYEGLKGGHHGRYDGKDGGGTNTGTNTGTNMRIRVGTNTETNTGTNMRIRVGTNTGTNTGTNMGLRNIIMSVCIACYSIFMYISFIIKTA